MIDFVVCVCRLSEVLDTEHWTNLTFSLRSFANSLTDHSVRCFIYDDSSNNIVRFLKPPSDGSFSTHISKSQQKGKYFQQIYHLSGTKADYVIFSDANTFYSPTTLFSLYHASSESGKLASGTLCHVTKGSLHSYLLEDISLSNCHTLAESSLARSTNRYLRVIESYLNVSLGVNGALFIVPTSFMNCVTIRDRNIQNDDFFLGVLISSVIGYTYATNSFCFEASDVKLANISASKYRDARGHFHTLVSLLKYKLKPIQYIGLLCRCALWNIPIIILVILILFFSHSAITSFVSISLVFALSLVFRSKAILILSSFIGFWDGIIRGQLVRW
jgi:hypothetical protein